MAEIRFSPEAITDLQQTKAYITEELCNEQAAIGTVAKITKRIRMLASFPESGATLSSIVDFETDYRFWVCGSYIAFYRIENQTVNIVRVLYGRRNFMKILFGEPGDN
ncbi:MAG: type II toxin-antitoxin system RelE/ParE family toxin [Lachnospiraceae bacterium]|nr:type II toxin-antitoxin system RelE/ParE family toxin [Lachnospiraceae bacterium]